ncbi:uncharacterized protein LOC126681988 [Mercurialis annua]|uniref:uncharacterized protein LOC126681988 n=1 Tax=Mercurialis annua TaxID=3986 RepID=UPI0024AD5713|nr:uncharacterized protein LOC126681988 [Mercurialis annua]
MECEDYVGKSNHKFMILPSFTKIFCKESRSCKLTTLAFPNGFPMRVRVSKMKNQKARIDITKLVELGYICKGSIITVAYKAFLQIEYPCNVPKFSKQRFSHNRTRIFNNEEIDEDQETTEDDDDQETTGDDDDDDNQETSDDEDEDSSVGEITNKDGKGVAARGAYRPPDMKSSCKKATKNDSNDDEEESTNDDDDDDDQETTLDDDDNDDEEDRKKSSKGKNKFIFSMDQRTKKDGKRVAAGDDYTKCKRKKYIGVEKDCKVKEEEETNSDESERSESEKQAEMVVAQNFESIYLKLSPESKRAIEAARNYKPNNPAFMSVITPQNMHSLVAVTKLMSQQAIISIFIDTKITEYVSNFSACKRASNSDSLAVISLAPYPSPRA